MRWKIWLKRGLFRLFYYSGLELLIARCTPAHAAAVIMYHGVCDSSRLPPEVDFHVKTAAFDQHMRMLKRRYPVVSLRELLDRMERGEPLRKEIVLTFDDGYRNNATAAHPILKRYSLPYTIYLSTAYIGGETWLPLNELYALWHFGRIDDARMKELRGQIRKHTSDADAILQGLKVSLTPAERDLAQDSFAMLNWDEVRKLAAEGVEFGSHTNTHCNMAAEPPDRQVEELATARRLIREEIGEDPASFAYPFGRPENWSQETRRNVMAAGHRSAILASGGLVAQGQDIFELPRVGFTNDTWHFACELMLLFLKRYIHQ